MILNCILEAKSRLLIPSQTLWLKRSSNIFFPVLRDPQKGLTECARDSPKKKLANIIAQRAISRKGLLEVHNGLQ